MKSAPAADARLAAVESLPAVAAALAVDMSLPSAGGCVFLFVVLHPGHTLDAALRAEIHRRTATFGPVPDAVYAVPDLPRTADGRVLHTAVRRVMAGEPPARVAAEERVDNPASLEPFAFLFNNL